MLLMLALAGAALPSPAPQDDTGPLVDRAAAYVLDYQQQLTAIVADETYTQRLRAQTPRDRAMPARRTTRSEMVFLFLPGHDWMALRDVIAVDGRPVTDRPSLSEALRTMAAPDVARKFKDRNARFNLGRIVRNFNEPTLGLLVLDAKHRARFTFATTRARGAGARRLSTVTFRESAGPTLVRDLNGRPVFSSGEIDIETDTGRVRRTRISLTSGTVLMTLATTYEEDARLEMLVPVRFEERYQDGPAPLRRARPSGPYEEITGDARYSNFRRFDVQTRIR